MFPWAGPHIPEWVSFLSTRDTTEKTEVQDSVASWPPSHPGCPAPEPQACKGEPFFHSFNLLLKKKKIIIIALPRCINF